MASFNLLFLALHEGVLIIRYLLFSIIGIYVVYLRWGVQRILCTFGDLGNYEVSKRYLVQSADQIA
jgi:hypothetical protein